MAKPYIHALSSAKKYGGMAVDYLDIHSFLDSSKSVISDQRHRALTHNSWFVGFVIEKVFGTTRVNSDGKTYSVRDIAEDHVSEDFHGFIPSAQDFLEQIEMKDWMQNGEGAPPSYAKVVNRLNRKQEEQEKKELEDQSLEKLNEQKEKDIKEMVKDHEKTFEERLEEAFKKEDALCGVESDNDELKEHKNVTDFGDDEEKGLVCDGSISRREEIKTDIKKIRKEAQEDRELLCLAVTERNRKARNSGWVSNMVCD